jgi:hypothetical protein
MARKLTAIPILILILFSCKHETLTVQQGGNNAGGSNGSGTVPATATGSGSNTNNCDPDTIYFRQQVLPILVSNCTMSGCHDERSRRDGVVLTSYTNVMSTARVRAGNPSSSELYEVLVENDPDDRMPRPPAAPLTSEQKAIIYKWIQQGARNLSCESACDTTTTVTYNGVVKALLNAKCTGCHGGSAPQAAIDLGNYNGVKSKVNDGRLWGAVNHHAGFSPMPKNGSKLSDCELAELRKWINAGSLNN